jgi:hypothetical protein
VFTNQQTKQLNELADALLLLDESVKQLREEINYLVEILDTDD